MRPLLVLLILLTGCTAHRATPTHSNEAPPPDPAASDARRARHTLDDPAVPAEVREAVRAYVEGDGRTRYQYASVDLNAPRDAEALVLLREPFAAWCGSGGCWMLVLNSRGELIGEMQVEPPVFIDNTRQGGWYDLVATSYGQGRTRFRYDGARYGEGEALPEGTPVEGALVFSAFDQE